MATHILVPLDGSTHARAAGQVALQIAAVYPDPHLVALHVVNVRPASGNFVADLPGLIGGAVVNDELAAQHQERGEQIVSDYAMKAAVRGVDVESVVEVGVVSKTILEHSHSADLVVMGIKGETEERFKGQGGEMSAWLPQQIATPLIMVPKHIDAISAFVLGYDGSPGAQHVARVIRALASKLEVPVHAIFVSEDGTGGEELHEVVEQMSDCTVHTHVVAGEHAHTTLVEKSSELGATVLGLGFKGAHPLRDFLFGTATERIIEKSDLAVLVVR